MKKCLLFLLPLFFLIPKNTFAKSYNVYPNWVRAMNDTTMVIDQNPSGWSLYNHNYHTFTTSSSKTFISSINWIYENKWPLDLDKNYDISFKIYQPNIGVSSLSSFNGGKPLVSFENKSCWVDYTSSNVDTSTVYGSTFNVLCENVSLGSKTFHIFVDTGPNNTDKTINGNRYGVGQNWDITLSSDNSDLQASIDKNTQTQEEIKDSITDSDTLDSQNSANSFFEDFENDDYGLSDIITMPLEYIRSFSSSCTPLTLPAVEPYWDSFRFPCMSSIYEEHFGSFLQIWQIITFGLVSYHVVIQIYAMVNKFKDPDNDDIEVMEL